MGRSVLEGVSMGRLGIVHGRWGTGGILHEKNKDELRMYNFSGRNSEGKMWSKEEFIKEIDRLYKKNTFDWGATYIAQNHNAKLAAQTYVEIARSLLGQDIIKDDRRPLKLARHKK